MKTVAILALLAVACGGGESKPPAAAAPAAKKTPPPPTAADAQTLIASSPEFSEYQFTNASVSMPMKITPVSRDAAKQLAAAGWLKIDGDAIALTEKAKSDKRFLARPNDTLDVVPLAKKEITGVTAVRGTDVDFTWKWIPNEVGAAFKSGDLHDRYAAQQRATATLLWDGTAWTVLRITPA